MPYKDPAQRKAKQAEYNRRYYESHREAHQARGRERKQRIRRWWRELKATLVCHACGEQHPACIDFHHVIADKRHREDIPSMWAAQGAYSEQQIIDKITQSCVPLCANCHRKVHWEHQQYLKERS